MLKFWSPSSCQPRTGRQRYQRSCSTSTSWASRGWISAGTSLRRLTRDIWLGDARMCPTSVFSDSASGGYPAIEPTHDRTEFPERPDALTKFLKSLKTEWNISLFHYRYHGGGECVYGTSVACIDYAWTDLAQILAGVQVPSSQSVEFDEFLQELGYPFVEETQNPVYQRYLRR
jgi:hypothetical protein